jgi:acyl transferase domain-containing protein
VLSPDGRCYAWDDRANGYGRGEGIATIILKPLDQAIRDGDNVPVVRETSVNQDGKTPTIT